VSAPVDVIEARTQLATFEQAVYLAQAQLTRAENSLKSLILANRSDPLWSSSLRPTALPKYFILSASPDRSIARRGRRLPAARRPYFISRRMRAGEGEK
jgi:outer membrane protein TolC